VSEGDHLRQYRLSGAPVLSSDAMVPPVGFFDSGVGGLSVARAFRSYAPLEPILYFADTAWFPYGGRPAGEIRKRAFAALHALIARGAKLVVVACNTASAAALSDLRAAFPVPIVGMVPGVKPAAAHTRSGVVLVLATPNTLDGELFRRVREEYGSGVHVRAVAGHGLAELVEEGRVGTREARVALERLLGPHVATGADVVVLGCTHYHFLMSDIRAIFPELTVVDTSDAVARRALAVLREEGLVAPDGAGPATFELIASGPRARFETVARSLVPELFAAHAETTA
jgi:glutamate racemase